MYDSTLSAYVQAIAKFVQTPAELDSSLLNMANALQGLSKGNNDDQLIATIGAIAQDLEHRIRLEYDDLVTRCSFYKAKKGKYPPAYWTAWLGQSKLIGADTPAINYSNATHIARLCNVSINDRLILKYAVEQQQGLMPPLVRGFAELGDKFISIGLDITELCEELKVDEAYFEAKFFDLGCDRRTFATLVTQHINNDHLSLSPKGKSVLELLVRQKHA